MFFQFIKNEYFASAFINVPIFFCFIFSKPDLPRLTANKFMIAVFEHFNMNQRYVHIRILLEKEKPCSYLCRTNFFYRSSCY